MSPFKSKIQSLNIQLGYKHPITIFAHIIFHAQRNAHYRNSTTRYEALSLNETQDTDTFRIYSRRLTCWHFISMIFSGQNFIHPGSRLLYVITGKQGYRYSELLHLPYSLRAYLSVGEFNLDELQNSM